MRLNIDHELCIGCGACVAEAGCELIDFNDEGLATPIEKKYTEEEENTIKNVKDVCPVDAISVEE